MTENPATPPVVIPDAFLEKATALNTAPPRPPDSPLRKVARVPRAFLESPSFRPDWRSEQAEAYLREIRLLGLDGVPESPPWEDDKVTVDYYRHLAGDDGGNGQQAATFRRARDYRTSATGARIKALAMTGAGDEAIAAKLGLPPRDVEFFVLLFFDIRAHRRNPYLMANFVRGVNGPAAGQDDWLWRYERLLLAVALHGPAALLEALLTGRDGFDPALSAECAELVLGQMAATGFAGLVIEKVTRAPEPADLDRALVLRRSRPWSDGEAGTEVPVPWHDQLIDALWGKGHGDTGASGESGNE